MALNLPEYQSHKRVRAGLILEVALDNVDQPTHGTLLIDGPALQSHRVTAAWIERHQPEIGGYLVVYEDGYESYSPAKAFTGGHTRVLGFQEELVRFCPDCGRIGEVPPKARDCCPDGSHARRIPKSLAERCRATFLLALRGVESVPIAEDGSYCVALHSDGTMTDLTQLYSNGKALPEIETLAGQVWNRPSLAASAPEVLLGRGVEQQCRRCTWRHTREEVASMNGCCPSCGRTWKPE